MQPPFFCDYGSNIELGERVFFNFNCVVLDVCQVRIGDFTLFGPAVQIYTPMHPINAELRRKQEFGKPIEIGSDVWVGGGAIICPGVRSARGPSSARAAWSRATSRKACSRRATRAGSSERSVGDGGRPDDVNAPPFWDSVYGRESMVRYSKASGDSANQRRSNRPRMWKTSTISTAGASALHQPETPSAGRYRAQSRRPRRADPPPTRRSRRRSAG